MKRMNRNLNSSIASGGGGGEEEQPAGNKNTTINYDILGVGEPLSHLAIVDAINVPVPPPPSPEIPGLFHSSKEQRSNSEYEVSLIQLEKASRLLTSLSLSQFCCEPEQRFGRK